MESNPVNTAVSNTSLAYFILKIFPFTKFFFDRFAWIEQFLNFGLVGFFNTLISYVTYVIVVSFNIHPQIAGIAGFITSVTNAWLMNKYWVFKHNNVSDLKTPVKFMAVYGGNLLFGVILIFIMYDCLHINKYIIPVISLCITVPVNFLLNKKWVFVSGKTG